MESREGHELKPVHHAAEFGLEFCDPVWTEFLRPRRCRDRAFKHTMTGVAEGVVAACRAFQDLKNESECACADEATSRSAHHREHRSGI